MLAITRRGPATLEKPPQIVRRNACRLPWAWGGLCFGVALHESSGQGLIDLVNNIRPSNVVIGEWERDERGNTAIYMQSDQGNVVEWPDNPRHDLPSTGLTAYVRLKIRAVTNAFPGYFSNWVTGDLTFGILGDSSLLGKMYGTIDVDSVVYDTSDTAVVPTTEYISAFLRWRSGETATLDVLSERGNVLTSAATASAVSGTLTYEAGKGIRLNESDSTFANGNYSQAMVWDRRLSDTELQALVADPFGWYSPRRETVGLSEAFVLPGYREPEWTFGQVVQVG